MQIRGEITRGLRLHIRYNGPFVRLLVEVSNHGVVIRHLPASSSFVSG